MKTYLYSIFVRSFLAFSGFLVFLLTASLYGADGRGVIGFGTSLFAVTGIVFSSNLGRAFLSRTKQNEAKKKNELKSFLKLNLFLSVISAVAGVVYWYFSDTARAMLSLQQVLCFSLTSFFYVWSVNGNSFFASFLATKRQENIILGTRLALLFFLVLLFIEKSSSLVSFVAGYSLILFVGVLIEMYFLGKSFGLTGTPFFLSRQAVTVMLKDSFFHHLDHLFFYLFPLILTVLSAAYLSKADVGRFNFVLQMISLVFLFAMTANIRLTAYVSDVGFRARSTQFKKLFWATFAASAVCVPLIGVGFSIAISYFKLQQFEGVQWLFLTCSISVPGYVIYQFFSPIWVELRREKYAAMAHGLNFVFCLSLAPVIMQRYSLQGLVVLFGLFYCGLIAAQFILYRKFIRPILLNQAVNHESAFTI